MYSSHSLKNYYVLINQYNETFNPFNPKLKKYNILPTFSREMYKWGSEN